MWQKQLKNKNILQVNWPIRTTKHAQIHLPWTQSVTHSLTRNKSSKKLSYSMAPAGHNSQLQSPHPLGTARHSHSYCWAWSRLPQWWTVARPHSLCSSHRPKIYLFPKAHHGQILTGTLGRVDWHLAPRLQVYRIQAQLTWWSLLQRAVSNLSPQHCLITGRELAEWEKKGRFEKSQFPSHTTCRYRPIKCTFSILWVYKPKSSLLVIYSKSLITNQRLSSNIFQTLH